MMRMRYPKALRNEISLHVALLIIFSFFAVCGAINFVKTIFTVIYKYLRSYAFLHSLFLFTDNIA